LNIMPLSVGSIQQSGIEIVLSNFEYLEDKFYDVLYTVPHYWRKVCPEECVERRVAPGATHFSYGARDVSGRGAFVGPRSQNIPIVGLSVSKPTVLPLLVGGVGGLISREDIRVYQHAMQQLGQSASLDTDISEIMSLAADRHVEGLFFYGDDQVGFKGWMDNVDVPFADAFEGGGSTTEWATKTPDEILKDINFYMSKIIQTTKQNFIPGKILLPIKQYDDIATRRLGDREITILDFIMKKNLYTAYTQQPLTIMAIPYLEGAGTNDTDRMVIQSDDKRTHVLPFPITYTLLPPQPDLYETFMLAEYKLGPYDNRYPDSMQYVDAI
jgi:hypothetical protein